MNALSRVLVHWVYPAERPSLVPFQIRRWLVNAVLPLLVLVHRGQCVLSRWVRL